jgi:hypothetical protein
VRIWVYGNARGNKRKVAERDRDRKKNTTSPWEKEDNKIKTDQRYRKMQAMAVHADMRCKTKILKRKKNTNSIS